MVQWLDDFGVPPWLRKPPFGFCGFSSKVQEIVFEPNRIAHDIKRYRSWIKWHVPLKLVKIKDIKRIQKVPRVARQGGLSWCFLGLAAIINLGFFLSISAQLSSTPFFFPNFTSARSIPGLCQCFPRSHAVIPRPNSCASVEDAATAKRWTAWVDRAEWWWILGDVVHASFSNITG
jgi:hypothetical protein